MWPTSKPLLQSKTPLGDPLPLHRSVSLVFVELPGTMSVDTEIYIPQPAPSCQTDQLSSSSFYISLRLQAHCEFIFTLNYSLLFLSLNASPIPRPANFPGAIPVYTSRVGDKNLNHTPKKTLDISHFLSGARGQDGTIYHACFPCRVGFHEYQLLEVVRCCSGCTPDCCLIVRIVSGNALRLLDRCIH